MNFNEACKILELSPDTSAEDAKKKYRELTKKYHPDINKEHGAEDRFKKINEAFQVFSQGDKNTDNIFDNNPWVPDFINMPPFWSTVPKEMPANINININISFKESVTGVKKDITLNRNIKCVNCHGQGMYIVNNGCEACGGKGKITIKQGIGYIITTCKKCKGKVNHESCPACSGKGYVNSDTSINVTIPGGIQHDNVLRLSGMGHYSPDFSSFIDAHSDAFLKVSVTAEPDLKIENKDVVSKLEISLLDALVGINKEVKTIYGTHTITVPPLSKNKDEVIIPNMGVIYGHSKGNQRVILNVVYPNNIDSLVNILKEK